MLPGPHGPTAIHQSKDLEHVGGVLLEQIVSERCAGSEAPFAHEEPISSPCFNVLPDQVDALVDDPFGRLTFETPNEVLVPIMQDVGVTRRWSELLPMVGRTGVLFVKNRRVDDKAIIACPTDQIVGS